MNESDHRLALPQGTRIQDFEFHRVLGQGGFGITYLGWNMALDIPVAIKEYLPYGLAVRDRDMSVVPLSSQAASDFAWGLDDFLEEARRLAQFNHPNIVRVHHFFEAHGTAYIVMEYAEGETLSEFLKRRGTLSEAELKAILYPILDGLEEVHGADFLHRDIKPLNIIIRDEDDSPVLIDFGAARQAIGVRSRSIDAIISPPYSPIEQYSSRGEQGPGTDLYALGAVCYRALTGEGPAEAPDRVALDPLVPASERCAGQAGSEFLSAIDWALQVHKTDRPQSIADWRVALGEETGSGVTIPPVGPPPAPPSEGQDREEVAVPPVHQRTDDRSERPKKSKGKLFATIACLLAVLIGGVSYYHYEYVPTQRAGRKFKDCGECPEMVVVPSGSFTMGSPSSEDSRDDDEGRHLVNIGYPLAVGVYEVTRREFSRFVSDTRYNAGNSCYVWNSSSNQWENRSGISWRNPDYTQADSHPVVCVSWEDAQSYVRWLSEKTDHRYSLLSESEWEYVARAGTTTPFHFGRTISTGQANYDGDYTYGSGRTGVDRGKTVSVGSFSPNAWGVHDMHGNVWEWVEDCWNDSYVGAPTDGSAWGSGDCVKRVLRGGSWISDPRSLRSATRLRNSTELRYFLNGFRVIRRF